MAMSEQMRNTMATVEAMVNGAGSVMQRLHPEAKIRSWNELTDQEKYMLASAWQSSLAPLARILAGKVQPGEQDTGVKP